MAASSCNYLVIYDGINQVYSAASEETALKSIPPKDMAIEDKHVFFITWEPDNKKLVVYEVDKKEVYDATQEAIDEAEAKKEAARKEKVLKEARERDDKVNRMVDTEFLIDE